MVYFCYIDESGVPQIPGNTSHYVLAGLSIPIHQWKFCDSQIEAVKSRFGLSGKEVHTAWIARSYLEQSRVPGFEMLDRPTRVYEVRKQRTAELLRLQKSGNPKQYKQVQKNYRKSEQYYPPQSG